MELESISHYRILEKLGEGGMGEVYLAEDSKLGRKVALKLLSEELTQNRDRLTRFDQEAYAASALNHPNILTIYEMGDDAGRHFIATEYVDGVTLRRRLAVSPIEVTEMLEIAIQVAGALEEAHSAGIVHRDIKPDNIMIRRNNHVKVLDFGLAKLTERPGDETDTEAITRAMVQTDAGVVLGTSAYMSPEQARGKPVDARTDIWSLGVVLYEMASGRPPFTGETKTDVIVAIAKTDPLPLARYAPNLPAELEWIVMKALRKNLEERYQTVKELETDLKKLKQRIEFEIELGRSMPSERLSGLVGAYPDTEVPISQQRTAIRMPESGAYSTGGMRSAQTRVSSAEYIVTGIRRHKTVAAISAFALVLVAAVAYFAYLRKPAMLTDKDSILLADFVNTTGDGMFDGSLKQGLAVQLGQSPFLDIFPEDRVRETLRFMDKSVDERITRELAKEICARQGIKAMLLGSISGVGGHYVISIEAVNSQTGQTIAREQIEVDGKEQVLPSLGQAASKLREKLGESLVSIQRFGAPIEQVTTPSLEALRAYSLGLQEHSRAKYLDAIPLYKHAIELDPNFAIAYARLANVYNNTGQYELSRQASTKAYEFRDRASEREKLYVSWSYYGGVTGEWDKTEEQLQVWKQIYPRDAQPRNVLANRATLIGDFDRAITEADEAIRINPKAAQPYVNKAVAFIGLGRLDEARIVLQQATSQQLETTNMHTRLYHIAFLQGDGAGMQQQIEWATGKPEEYLAQVWQAQTAAALGQLSKARDLNQHALELAQGRNLTAATLRIILEQAQQSATIGDCAQVNALTSKALATSRDNSVLIAAGNALTTCGQTAPAQTLIEELSRRFPVDTFLNSLWLPVMRARLEVERGDPAKAIQLLEPARRYETAGEFWPQYLRGMAYLKQRNGTQAAAEFQSIVTHRSWFPLSQLYPLAHLGLARAAVLNGDEAKARKEYQDFLALWKDADHASPILLEALKEYEKLK